MTLPNVVAISGMMLDVLGAVVLARSFILKRPQEVFRELGSFGTFDFHITRAAMDLLLSWLVQALESRTGAVILAIGFILQGLSLLLPQAPVPYAALVLILVAAGAVWSFFLLQAAFVRRAARQAQAFYAQLEPKVNSDDWRREIPLRREELQRIDEEPGRWLRR